MPAIAGLSLTYLGTGAVLAGVGYGLSTIPEVKKGFQDVTGTTARREARKAGEKQERKQAQLEAEARERVAGAEAAAAGTLAAQAARARQRGAAGQGARETILTGPLGLMSQPETAQKTLLGL